MTKNISNFSYFLLFIGLSVASYSIIFFIDYSTEYFTIARVLNIGVCFFYFYKLVRHLTYLKGVAEKLNTYSSANNHGKTLIAFCLLVSHLILIDFGGEKLNEKLLLMDNLETIATIKDCHSSKGTEYCIYSYSVDNKHYEIKYFNNNMKFKENDRTTVIYFSKFPIISKLKKEFLTLK